MKFQLILIQLFLIPAVLVEGFTSTTKKSFPRPEHLRYANLERSSLFSADHNVAVQHLQEERIRERDGQQRLARKQHDKSEEPNCQSPSCSDNSAMHPEQHSPSVNNRHASKDWLYNLRSLPRSSVLQEIKNPVLSLAGWATMLSIVQRIFSISSNPSLRIFANNMCVPHSAHSFLVSSLGLLLVFRTNSAYQRFLEGRKIWENILSISRNLSRMVTLYEKEVGTQRVGRIKSLLASYPYLLRHHIRKGCLCNDEQDMINDKYRLLLHEPSAGIIDSRYEGDKASGGSWVPAGMDGSRPCWVDRRDMPWCLLDRGSTLNHVAKSQNRPLWVCDRLGREIMDVGYTRNYTSRERLALLSSVDKLTNAIGECERIHQTAVPLNYARHALRGLTMWLFTLPFSLVKDLGLLTGPATAVIAWLLFGVYQIGHSIEDPFQGSLRLSMLCDGIRRDILEGTSGDDFSSRRASAFGLEDDWEEEEEIGRIDSNSFVPFPSSTKTQKDMETVLSNAPKLVNENGDWIVLGA